MKVRISDARLEGLIAEDIPYIDLTSEVLGITDQTGEMEYYTREDCVLCGTEEVARMAELLGLQVEEVKPSGVQVDAGQMFLKLRGNSGALHMLWKVGLNTLDHLSAVATNTRRIVNQAKAGNPACEVLTTRKSMPGVKDLLTKAVTVGGAFPHRLGLSETMLVFDHHMEFLGGFQAFLENLPSLRSRCVEKKLFVEANAQQAIELAKVGIDGIQFDKVPVDELGALVKQLREIDPRITLIAAGGINAKNACEYATTGVDGLATTAPFSAKPLDMSICMRAC